MKIAMIYMASGFGSRFGENKLLAALDGKPLYLHGLEMLLSASERVREEGWERAEVIVVSQYEEILAEAKKRNALGIYNRRSREGITASLKLGTEAAFPDTDAFLYFVADQPFFKEETLLSFLSGYERSGKGIGCVCCHGKLGNPSIFCAAYREALLALSGDKGGKQIIRAHTEDLWTMEVSDRELHDIDIREDLQEK